MNANVKGIYFILLYVAFVSILDAVFKFLSEAEFTPYQILFFRSFFGLLPLIIYRAQTRTVRELVKTNRLSFHIFRSLVGYMVMVIFIFAYPLMPLADLLALSFVAPIFVTLLSVLILKEVVGVYRWAAIVVGIIGMVLITQPTLSTDGYLGPILVIMGSLLYAYEIIQTRQLATTEHVFTMAFWFTIPWVIISLVLMIPFWHTPTLTELLLLVLTGVLGGFAQIYISKALSLSDASLLAPFEYLTLLWAIGFGYLLWAEVPTETMLTGSAIVIFAGLFIFYRENKFANDN